MPKQVRHDEFKKMTNILSLRKELKALANPEKAKFLQRFFKTGKGEYAENDVLLGIKVPDSRKLAKKYKDLSRNEITQLLTSKFHEERLIALFILVLQYKKGDEVTRKRIVDLYLSHTDYCNNWDLVDSSAPYILGDYLLDKPRKILYTLAHSKSLWEKRIAILATAAFIKHHEYEDTLKIAEILLKDPRDLIHKGVGWMLREVGNRDKATEIVFLNKYASTMPRTMLRYAIEKFPQHERASFMKRQ